MWVLQDLFQDSKSGLHSYTYTYYDLYYLIPVDFSCARNSKLIACSNESGFHIDKLSCPIFWCLIY